MTKYANMPYGYDSGRTGMKDPWWQHPTFPLVPMFERQQGDEWNANNWNFSWLWFRIWSLEHFSVEVGAELESTGLNILARLGWLRIVVRVIPLPYGWNDRLRRKPAKEAA